MTTNIAINGFGRIGRLVLRAIFESGREDLRVVAVNDLGTVATNAHLLKWDSNHGRFPGEISVHEDAIDIGFGPIKFTSERDPKQLPHEELDVDIVMECTGIFTDRVRAARHIEGGAKRVLVSAPAKNADITVVFGVNHDKIRKGHEVISSASCTTNCLVPVAYVLNNTVGIETGYMTTVHSYTGDQPTLDTFHGDLRRARGAASSMVPTSTGAAKAVGLVLPELAGKLDGAAIRVPTSNVSLIDLKFMPKRPTNVEEINSAMIEAANNGPLTGILGINDEPLVSIDFNHNSNSSTFDLNQTQVLDGGLVRVLAWYDNEWGFSTRMSDTAAFLADML